MDVFQTQEKRVIAITHSIKQCISDHFPSKSNQILPWKLNGASWSVQSQQEPVIISHCLYHASHCCYLPLKEMHSGHPHLQKGKLNTVTQVATTQLQAGAPALSGIPAHKHLRQQQQGEVESVAVWHLLCKHCFFQQGTTFQREGHHKLYLGVSEQYQNQYSRISL